MRGEPGRVVGVLGPVDGGDEVVAVLVDAGRQLRGPRRGGRQHGVPDAQADVGHDVAHEHGAGRETLGRELPDGDLGRGEQQVAGVVGEHPVVLLRHARG